VLSIVFVLVVMLAVFDKPASPAVVIIRSAFLCVAIVATYTGSEHTLHSLLLIRMTVLGTMVVMSALGIELLPALSILRYAMPELVLGPTHTCPVVPPSHSTNVDESSLLHLRHFLIVIMHMFESMLVTKHATPTPAASLSAILGVIAFVIMFVFIIAPI